VREASAPSLDGARPSAAARVVAALLAARLAFGVAYLGGALRRAPIPWYHPLERAWSFGSAPGPGLAMEWYGRTGAALAVGVAAGGVIWVMSARGRAARALSRPALVLALARAVGLALLVDFTYFGWAMMHAALTLPPCPR
jgi:hypothetical protein